MSITASDLSWLGGVLDSTGSIKAYGQKGVMRPWLKIQGPSDLLDAVSVLTGYGWKVYARSGGFAVSRNPEMTIAGNGAYIILSGVKPHMRVRWREVSRVLEECPLTWGSRSRGVINKMSDLGWEIPSE